MDGLADARDFVLGVKTPFLGHPHINRTSKTKMFYEDQAAGKKSFALLSIISCIFSGDGLA